MEKLGLTLVTHIFSLLPPSLPPSLLTVCDDHHFKDEYLFYRFKNDEKPSHSPRLGSRLGIKKSSSKKTRSEDDAGSQGSMESRGSGASWDSLSTGEVPARRSPEADE